MIKLFAFDLGNVILPFDNLPISRKLHERSRIKDRCSADEIHHYLFDTDEGSINPYEEGLCSSLQFFLEVRDRYGLEMEFEEFKPMWNYIFTENPEVNQIIHYLKSRDYPLFLLSNTNELHFTHIIDKYPIVHLMDEFILSFEVGAKKPKKRIFDAIFEKADVEPEEVLYIDDVVQYIEVARGLGLHGVVFRQPEELRQALRENGI
jgi:glucose-1-phosphatase